MQRVNDDFKMNSVISLITQKIVLTSGKKGNSSDITVSSSNLRPWETLIKKTELCERLWKSERRPPSAAESQGSFSSRGAHRSSKLWRHGESKEQSARDWLTISRARKVAEFCSQKSSKIWGLIPMQHKCCLQRLALRNMREI